MFKFRFLLLLASAFGSTSCFATYEWGFADVSLNHLDWSADTEGKSTKTDFNYLELEGGAGYSWGDLYGFFDMENVGKDGSIVRTAAKGVARWTVPHTDLSLYGHVYNFTQIGFSEQNRVLGLGYTFQGKWGWLKPFLGKHDVSQTYFSGSNGFMGGWVFYIPIKVSGQSFSVTDWHEIEFDRADAYAATYGGKTTSHNGALAAWWDIVPAVTVGLQWRYATDKLGTKGAMNAGIGTLRYNF
jgi:hypothetical protein